MIPIDQEKVVLEILAGKGFTCTIIKNNEIKVIEDSEDFPEGMFPKESKDSTLLESDQEDIEEEGDDDESIEAKVSKKIKHKRVYSSSGNEEVEIDNSTKISPAKKTKRGKKTFNDDKENN